MKPCKILAVLLTLTLTVGCSTSASNETTTLDRSYKMGKILNVSDGKVRIQLAVDESNGVASGQTFWADLNRISTVVNENLSGTYVYVRGVGLGKRDIALSQVYNVLIAVRTEEQKERWDSFLTEQRNVAYGSRDVYPPEISR